MKEDWRWFGKSKALFKKSLEGPTYILRLGKGIQWNLLGQPLSARNIDVQFQSSVSFFTRHRTRSPTHSSTRKPLPSTI